VYQHKWFKVKSDCQTRYQTFPSTPTSSGNSMSTMRQTTSSSIFTWIHYTNTEKSLLQAVLGKPKPGAKMLFACHAVAMENWLHQLSFLCSISKYINFYERASNGSSSSNIQNNAMFISSLGKHRKSIPRVKLSLWRDFDMYQTMLLIGQF
jgi:uncharacterized protein YvpB